MARVRICASGWQTLEVQADVPRPCAREKRTVACSRVYGSPTLSSNVVRLTRFSAQAVQQSWNVCHLAPHAKAGEKRTWHSMTSLPRLPARLAVSLAPGRGRHSPAEAHVLKNVLKWAGSRAKETLKMEEDGACRRRIKAGEGTRTLVILLGKQTLCQLSYTRVLGAHPPLGSPVRCADPTTLGPSAASSIRQTGNPPDNPRRPDRPPAADPSAGRPRWACGRLPYCTCGTSSPSSNTT